MQTDVAGYGNPGIQALQRLFTCDGCRRLRHVCGRVREPVATPAWREQLPLVTRWQVLSEINARGASHEARLCFRNLLGNG